MRAGALLLALAFIRAQDDERAVPDYVVGPEEYEHLVLPGDRHFWLRKTEVPGLGTVQAYMTGMITSHSCPREGSCPGDEEPSSVTEQSSFGFHKRVVCADYGLEWVELPAPKSGYGDYGEDGGSLAPEARCLELKLGFELRSGSGEPGTGAIAPMHRFPASFVARARRDFESFHAACELSKPKAAARPKKRGKPANRSPMPKEALPPLLPLPK